MKDTYFKCAGCGVDVWVDPEDQWCKECLAPKPYSTRVRRVGGKREAYDVLLTVGAQTFAIGLPWSFESAQWLEGQVRAAMDKVIAAAKAEAAK